MSNDIKSDKEIIQSIIATSEGDYSDKTIDILGCIVTEHNHSIDEETPDEVIEALDVIEAGLGGDFTLDFDGNEYRIISEDIIDSVYTDAIKDIVSDCYPEVEKALEHSWIAIEIDWDKTVENAMQDGYGHTFSGYDGSEYEAGGHYVFRTN